MTKNYEVLNELVPKTQELHQDIFDKGYEQGKQVLDKIRAEIMQVANQEKFYDEKWALGLIHAVKIIDKYKTESEDI